MSLWKTATKENTSSLADKVRQRVGSVQRVGPSKWIVIGDSELGDSSNHYTVEYRRDEWACSCFPTEYNESRRRRSCSHILAVRLVRKKELANLSAGAKSEPDQSSASQFPYTPGDLNLPARFEKWRPHQEYALERIANSDKRVILLDAPTGSGKSLIAAGLQRYTGQNLLYVVHTKQLQDQIEEEFPYAAVLKGRANYPTANFPDITCDMCQKTKTVPCKYCAVQGEDGALIPKSDSARCPYQIAKRRLMAAELGVVNMALFLGEANYVGGLSGWSWVVLDEGDLTERSLMGFREVYVPRRLIKQFELEPPKQKTKQEAWEAWARVTRDRLIAINARTTEWEVKLKKSIERLIGRLNFFINNIDIGKWVNCTRKDDWLGGPWIFKPTYINTYAEEDLWQHGSRFLVMSATILSPDQFVRDLGLKRSEVEFIQLPSVFPVERRPIYRQPVAEMSYRKRRTEAPKVAKAVRDIIASKPGKKILVHTVSYWLTKLIIEAIDDDRPVMTYNEAEGRTEALERFKASTDGAVLVAPSMGRGVNLPYSLCECVILPKMTYPSLSDPQISSRLYSSRRGRDWYIVQTVRDLIQASGRGMRYEDDSCEIYILDKLFDEVYKKHRKLFPKWWRDALRPVPKKVPEGA